MKALSLVFLLCLVLTLMLAVGCGDDDDDDCGDDDDDSVGDDDSADDDDSENDEDDDDDDSIVDDDDDDDDDTVGDDDDAVGPITLTLVDGCNPFATTDVCLLPYPSAFFQEEDPASPTGVRVAIPAEALPIPAGVTPIDMELTNTADGVSPAGPILLHFAKDIHPDHLTTIHHLDDSLAPGAPIALFDMETGQRVRFMSEMDMNRKVLHPDRYALIVRPMEPMKMGHRHVAVLTDALTDADDLPLFSPEPFAVLRDDIPVTNTEIEDVRDHYDTIFEFLEEQGYQRERLLLAFDFMVASEDYLLGSMLSMRETALDEMAGTGLDYVIESVEDDPNSNLARIVIGTFEVPTFLRADQTFEYDADHHPIRQPSNMSFPFTMIIPKKADLGQPLPLMVWGHGLFGNGRDNMIGGMGIDVLQPAAEDAGVIMIATDWIGLSSGDLSLIIDEILPDINRITLITDRLQQSLINNLTLTELAIGDLADDPQVKIGANDLIDDTRVFYAGGSLGGTQGASFMAISNRFTRGVMSVPGAVWLNMIPRSVHWWPIKLVMDVLYPDPLLQQMGVGIVQTRFDLSDPVNLSHLMFTAPLPDAPPGRTVLLQVAIGDSQVPNMCSEMLARAIGMKQMTPSIYPIPGLDPVTSPTTESALEQYYMVEQVLANPPPEDNTPPLTGNGVHYDAIVMPHVMEQSIHFLLDGEIVQNCDGLCDPD
jgi:hypothetical protein